MRTAPGTALGGALQTAARAAGEELEVLRRVERRDLWRAAGASVVALLAESDAGRARLAREARLYGWAHAESLPVPSLVAADPPAGFVLIERVRTDAPRGPSYVDAALKAAAKIAAANPPPRELLEGRERRASRWWSVPIRFARLAALPLPVREVISVGRRFNALPHTSLAHGDFHCNNVLHDETRRRVHVVDLEFVGRAPAYSDVATLWGALADDGDRRQVVDVLSASLSRDERLQLGTVLHWIALRYLLEIFTWTPRAAWNRKRLSRGLRVLEEAREMDLTWRR